MSFNRLRRRRFAPFAPAFLFRRLRLFFAERRRRDRLQLRWFFVLLRQLLFAPLPFAQPLLLPFARPLLLFVVPQAWFRRPPRFLFVPRLPFHSVPTRLFLCIPLRLLRSRLSHPFRCVRLHLRRFVPDRLPLSLLRPFILVHALRSACIPAIIVVRRRLLRLRRQLNNCGQFLSRRPRESAFAEDVDVQVRDAFASVRSAVDDDAVTSLQQIELFRHHA